MGMADLIVKIVRAVNPDVGSSEPYPRYGGTTAAGTPARALHNKNNNDSSKIPTWQDRHHETQIEVGDEVDGLEMERYGMNAIKKTTVTEVVTVDREERKYHGRQSRIDVMEREDEMVSSSSSTRKLKGNRRGSSD